MFGSKLSDKKISGKIFFLCLTIYTYNIRGIQDYDRKHHKEIYHQKKKRGSQEDYYHEFRCKRRQKKSSQGGGQGVLL